MRRHDKVISTVVIDNEPGKESDNLMEKLQCQKPVHNEFVSEENISEDKDIIKGKPPQVEDDFTTH